MEKKQHVELLLHPNMNVNQNDDEDVAIGMIS